MEALDELITTEERKIDHLTQIRHNPSTCTEMPDYPGRAAAEIDHDIEKAYEQLAIYKIRKMMGF